MSDISKQKLLESISKQTMLNHKDEFHKVAGKEMEEIEEVPGEQGPTGIESIMDENLETMAKLLREKKAREECNYNLRVLGEKLILEVEDESAQGNSMKR